MMVGAGGYMTVGGGGYMTGGAGGCMMGGAGGYMMGGAGIYVGWSFTCFYYILCFSFMYVSRLSISINSLLLSSL